MVELALQPVETSLPQRRRELRFPCDPIPALLKTATGHHAAWVLDISYSGVRLELQISLTVATEVTIYFGSTIAAGEVRYCNPASPDTWHAGLQVQDVRNTA